MVIYSIILSIYVSNFIFVFNVWFLYIIHSVITIIIAFNCLVIYLYSSYLFINIELYIYVSNFIFIFNVY